MFFIGCNSEKHEKDGVYSYDTSLILSIIDNENNDLLNKNSNNYKKLNVFYLEKNNKTLLTAKIHKEKNYLYNLIAIDLGDIILKERNTKISYLTLEFDCKLTHKLKIEWNRGETYCSINKVWCNNRLLMDANDINQVYPIQIVK